MSESVGSRRELRNRPVQTWSEEETGTQRRDVICLELPGQSCIFPSWQLPGWQRGPPAPRPCFLTTRPVTLTSSENVDSVSVPWTAAFSHSSPTSPSTQFKTLLGSAFFHPPTRWAPLLWTPLCLAHTFAIRHPMDVMMVYDLWLQPCRLRRGPSMSILASLPPAQSLAQQALDRHRHGTGGAGQSTLMSGRLPMDLAPQVSSKSWAPR